MWKIHHAGVLSHQMWARILQIRFNFWLRQERDANVIENSDRQTNQRQTHANYWHIEENSLTPITVRIVVRGHEKSKASCMIARANVIYFTVYVHSKMSATVWTPAVCSFHPINAFKCDVNTIVNTVCFLLFNLSMNWN